jgi:hypothetical protein
MSSPQFGQSPPGHAGISLIPIEAGNESTNEPWSMRIRLHVLNHSADFGFTLTLLQNDRNVDGFSAESDFAIGATAWLFSSGIVQAQSVGQVTNRLAEVGAEEMASWPSDDPIGGCVVRVTTRHKLPNPVQSATILARPPSRPWHGITLQRQFAESQSE